MTVFGISYTPEAEEEFKMIPKKKRTAEEEAEEKERRELEDRAIEELRRQALDVPPMSLMYREKRNLLLFPPSQRLRVYRQLIQTKLRHAEEVYMRRSLMEPVREYLVGVFRWRSRPALSVARRLVPARLVHGHAESAILHAASLEVSESVYRLQSELQELARVHSKRREGWGISAIGDPAGESGRLWHLPPPVCGDFHSEQRSVRFRQKVLDARHLEERLPSLPDRSKTGVRYAKADRCGDRRDDVAACAKGRQGGNGKRIGDRVFGGRSEAETKASRSQEGPRSTESERKGESEEE